MALQPNLNGIPRFGYVAAGLGMMGWGFFFASPGLAHAAWPIAGALVLTAGLIGYCPVVALFGPSVKKN